jgi:N4-gp56 family major capsid protein
LQKDIKRRRKKMEKLLQLNIQLFAEDLKSANTATYGKRMSETEAHTYYDMTLKDALYENYNAEKYFDTITLPQNHGKKMRFRKSGKYVTNGQPLVEGIIPEEDKPMETYEYEVSLQSFGGYIKFTDELDLFSIDKGESTRLQRNQGYAVGDLFQEKARNILLSSKNVWFAGNSAADLASVTTLQGGLDKCKGFDLDDLRKIKVFLNRTKVKPYEGGDYVMIVSPEVESDIMTLAKSDSKFSFIELSAYTQNTKPLMEGEIGRWNNFRFVRDNMIKEVAKTSSNSPIHGCVILGKYNNEKGAKLVKLAGAGAPKTILKPLESGGANENPLNQVGSIGWKCHGWGGTILYSEAVMVYYCLADAAAEEFSNKERDAFIGGYDAEGNAIAPVAENIHANGEEFTAKLLTVKVSAEGKSVGQVARYVVTTNAEVKAILDKLAVNEELINHYATASNKVVFYGQVACSSAYSTSTEGAVSADVTVYVKKEI